MYRRPCLPVVILAVLSLTLFPSRGFGQPISPSRLKSPSVDVPPDWLTPAESTSFRQTPRYHETVAFSRRLAQSSRWIDYQTFGTSPEGRELPLLIVSTDQAFTPQAARATGKLVVLVQNCIHAGECAGKDASFMLLRDMVITRTRAGLLDNVILVVIPIFNVDGHERFSPYSRINQNGPEVMGWRTTSRNLNLNRDYMKADAVETRAWLALWNAWRPDLHFDNHTTDGGDWQYDITFASDTYQSAAPQVAKWLEGTLYAGLFRVLKADGHVPMFYFWMVDSKDPSKGIRSSGFGPRFATGYASIRNRPSILVETHMLKPYRTRVIGHYNIMLHTLELLNQDAGSLRQAVRRADESTAALGAAHDSERRLPIGLERTDESIPLTFQGYAYHRELSPISGDVRIIYDNTKPVEIETVYYSGTKVSKEINPPLAYIIPPQWTEAIELAQAHGLRCRRLIEPISAEFESYRFTDVTFPKRSYESRFLPKYQTESIVEKRTYLPGSVVVPLDQPDAKVAVHLLEPEARDSLVAWGFFNAIFEQKEYGEHYVLEELAHTMLEADPELRKEFEERVRTDREFASSPRARLQFFYKRSPYWDERMNVYPIARITKPIDAKTERM
ncbi:MAG: M14 family metallopeptidase [Phycisphaerales bacterium]|nr:MAG: M14 family metallopeptidase [Phycisphaerales bacterium]